MAVAAACGVRPVSFYESPLSSLLHVCAPSLPLFASVVFAVSVSGHVCRHLVRGSIGFGPWRWRSIYVGFLVGYVF